jgi:superfamily II DNA or RNA helicase
MKLVLHDSYAEVEAFEDDEEPTLLRSILTFETKQWVPRMRQFVPAKLPMLDERRMTFPIGHTPTVRMLFSQEGKTVTVTSARKRPGGGPNFKVLDDLGKVPRPFQRAAIEKVMTRSFGIVKAPLGSGKTLCAVGCMASQPDINWVVFCPKDTLVDQMAAEYEAALAEKPGVIKQGCFKPKKVTILTFSQARSKWDQVLPILEKANGIIVDEVHTGSAESHLKAIRACKNAYYRIGFSATPLDRSDEKSILAIGEFGPIAYEISTTELMDLGYVAKPKIKFVSFLHADDGKAARYSEPAALYRHCIVKNNSRNELLAQVALKASKPSILFVLRNEHVNMVHERLSSVGVSAAAVDQRTHPERRQEIISKTRKGEYDVIVASSVFNDGVNIPELASVIVATGYKSTIATLQRLGRGARITEGKTEFEVWDIGDTGAFGSKHTQARDKAYQREGYETQFIQPGDLK